MGQYSFSCAACCGSSSSSSGSGSSSGSSSSGTLTQCPTYSSQPANVPVSGSVTYNGTSYTVDGYLEWDAANSAWSYVSNVSTGNYALLVNQTSGTSDCLMCITAAGAPPAWGITSASTVPDDGGVYYFLVQLMGGSSFVNAAQAFVWLPLYETPQGTTVPSSSNSVVYTGSVTFG